MTDTGSVPTGDKAAPVADARPGNWVDRWAPAIARPYLRLARADRPIGTWLLLWPCWWSLAMAAGAEANAYPNLWHMVLFAIGAYVMRGGGCVYNDIVDREFDARVERTRSRPIPSGQVSVTAAIIFMLALCLIGLAVLLQFNWFSVILGMSSLAIIVVYPFMKRITWWPQAVLGIVFNWGALMGWAVTFGRLDAPALLLYAGAIFWTIGYDTIYGHQDKDDDALLGLKSTSLRFGDNTGRWVAGFYSLAFAGFVLAGLMAGAGPVFIMAMLPAGLHLAWQVRTLDTGDPDNCLVRFRANRDLGAIIFAALLADAVVRAWL